MRTIRNQFRVALILSVATVLLAGCSATKNNAADFSKADLMFAQMMIPHHKQAIEMSDLALEISENPEIVSLARRIKKAQAPEIEQMQLWLDTGDAGHMGHDMMDDFDEASDGMMGMLDDGEFTELQNATGIEFDRLFLKGMIAHHEGAIDMADMVVGSENKEAAALGQSIIDTQKAEIEEMRTLLASIS